MFEANAGQADPDVRFLSRGERSTMFVTGRGISWTFAQRSGGRQKLRSIAFEPQGIGAPISWKPQGALRARANYFLGNDPKRWHTEVPLYSSLRANNIYPRVDLVLHNEKHAPAQNQGFEYDLVVSPAAHQDRNSPRATTDPAAQVRFSVRGAGKMWLDSNGNLQMSVGPGLFRMAKPFAYQLNQRKRISVDVQYVLQSKNTFGFRIGSYDHSELLIIDPTISVSYSSFLGGGGADSANSIALDEYGLAYVGGTTTSPLFPETGASNNGPLGGPSDFFVAKINPNISGAGSLLYLTYIGGTGDEEGGAIAVNSSQQAVIAGSTTSIDFPVVSPYQETLNGSSDLAIAELNANGNGLAFSTYFGGSGAEATQNYVSAALDSSDNIYVTSDTNSTDLPVTASSFQTTYGGGVSDGFLAIFDPTGSLSYCTYFGIKATVGATGVAVDGASPPNVYVSGYTSKPSGTSFPTTEAVQSTYGGGNFDGFAMKFDPLSQGATDLVYSTFLGGSGSDQALAIAVDNASPANTYVAGTTQSSDFPVSGTNVGYQTALTGTSNAFLAVIATNSFTQANSLLYSTYLGGGGDSANSVFALASSAVYLSGTTISPVFPTLASLQSFTGTSDAFLSKFDTTQSGATSLLYSALFGGEADSSGNSVVANSSGSVLLAGATTSNDFPVAGNPQNGFQLTCASCSQNPPLSDAFVTEITESGSPAPIVSFQPATANFGSQPVGSQNVPPQFVTITNAGNATLNISSLQIAGANASDFSLEFSDQCAPMTLLPGNKCSFEIGFTPSTVGKEFADVEVADNAPASPQALPLLGTGAGALASPSPAGLSFGNQPINTTSNALTATIFNDGNQPLVFDNINLTGSNSSSFTLPGPETCSGQGSVAAGSSCVITVAFAPKATGNFTAQIDIFDNSDDMPNAEQIIPISGMGTPPASVASVNPSSLTFGSESVGTPTGAQNVTVTNTGSLALQFSAITISGQNATEFSVVPSATTCSIIGSGVASNSSCTIGVSFDPASNGAKSATLTLTDNASPSTQQVALSGSGFSAGLTLSASSLAFGSVNVNAKSAAQNVTLSNTGNTTLTILGFSLTGADTSDFSQTNNCPPTVAQNSSCTIAVLFNPAAAGSRTAALTIADTAPGSPQSISLSGTALGTSASLSPASLSFPAQLVGTAGAAIPVTLTNKGTGTLSASGISFTGANASDFSETDNCGTNVAVGGSCTINVVFTPIATGSRAAILNVIDNAPGGPQTVSLAGTADDFSITVASGAPSSATMSSTEAAAFSLQVNPLAGFAGTVAVACAGVPTGVSCNSSPASVQVNTSAAVPFTVNLALATGSGVPLNSTRPWRTWRRLRLVGFTLGTLLLFAAVGFRNSRYRGWRLAFSLLAAGAALGACAASATNQLELPVGTYTLTVAGSVQGGTRSVNVTLSVQSN